MAGVKTVKTGESREEMLSRLTVAHGADTTRLQQMLANLRELGHSSASIADYQRRMERLQAAFEARKRK